MIFGRDDLLKKNRQKENLRNYVNQDFKNKERNKWLANKKQKNIGLQG